MSFGFAPEELRELRAAFAEEAREHLEAIDDALASLEAAPAVNEAAAWAELLRQLHTIKGSAGAVELDDVSRSAHALEDQVVALRASAPPDAAALELLRRNIELLRRNIVLPAPPPERPTAERRADEPPEGERRRVVERRATEAIQLRVEVERVDALMDAVGELVIDRTRVARRLQELDGCTRDLAALRHGLRARARTSTDPLAARRLAELEAELAEGVGNLGRAVAGMADDADGLRRTSQVLQEGLQGVRMMSVGRLFSRAAAALAEMGRRAGKDVRLVTDGDETNVDKVLVERIGDPLMHLLRNAVAHGIESPEARAQAGKPIAGRVRLAAMQRGHQLVLEISDDGAGIDRERVRAALLASGRFSVEQAAALEGEALDRAVLEERVSTRDTADDLAGRGVGLDAVRAAIARLGGVISVVSAPGAGTRFTVRVPLATSITQALLFKVGGQVYAVPATAVIETAQIEPDAVQRGGEEGERVSVHDEVLPLVRLGALLGAPTPPSSRRWAVVVEHEGLRFAFTCDKVVGPREIVVKALGPLLAPLPLYAGATISGAGKVQLIIELSTLVAHARAGATLGTRPGDQAGRRVLVADDSRSLRESAALLLSQGGYRVDTVPDGWDAWELLQDQRFDLLITDVEMPRLDGCELTSRVRHDPDLQHMSVLVMSARTGEATRHRAIAAGADGFLAKPLRRRPLLDAVLAALSARG